ncbi:MAG: hypothetical protein DID89_2727547344 [Candidatus Nitrotoga sp. CP45]|nr:MAG: hypothetical protein DID89_2727547344 [Candidatus Nitrotoga sp. CP45]
MTIGYDNVWNEIPQTKLKTSDGTTIKKLIGALTKDVKAFNLFTRLT